MRGAALSALSLLLIDSIAVVESDSKRLLLISFDGFRYDLLNSSFTPFMAEWASGGAWFKNGVQSQYVTYTAPNHMSIVTGLLENSHGIVSNYFYDPVSKEPFDIFNMTGKPGVANRSLDEHWYNGEPIWLTNERSGGKSVVMYWPAGDAHFKGEPPQPTIHKSWTEYGDLPKWMKDVDELVDSLAEPKNTFAAFYVAEPDHTLHTYGFYFEELLKKKAGISPLELVAELDKLVRYLVDRLQDRGLLDTTDIILTADHGHAEIEGATHVMCIPDFVSGTVGVDYQIGDHMIYPADEAHAQAIYANLSKAIKDHGYKINLYYKKDLPARFHYDGTPRVGEIVYDAEIGWATSLNCTTSKLKQQYGEDLKTNPFHSSTHGMDPAHREMRAMLVMRGPSFVEKKLITDVPENVDLYGLMASILGAKAAPNNGSLTIVSQALRSDSVAALAISHPKSSTYMPTAIDSLGFLFFVVPSIVIVILFFAYAWRRTVVMEDPTWALATDNRYKPLATTINEAFEYSPTMERRENAPASGGAMKVSVNDRKGALLASSPTSSDSEDDFLTLR